MESIWHWNWLTEQVVKIFQGCRADNRRRNTCRFTKRYFALSLTSALIRTRDEFVPSLDMTHANATCAMLTPLSLAIRSTLQKLKVELIQPFCELVVLMDPLTHLQFLQWCSRCITSWGGQPAHVWYPFGLRQVSWVSHVRVATREWSQPQGAMHICVL